MNIQFTKSWRYKIGLFLIFFGHISLLSGIILSVIGLTIKHKTELISILLVGGEMLCLSSIVLLGKDGFNAIKSKVFELFKKGFKTQVSKTRHNIGLIIFLVHIVTVWVLYLYAWSSFKMITPQTPLPRVWGMDIEAQGSFVLWLFIIGESSFLISIYVLGADWWEKFRQLFIWQKK